MTSPVLPGLDGARVVVAGAGVSGAAAARVLRDLGADVVVAESDAARAAAAREEGFEVRALDAPPPGTGLVVTSPGWRPDAPLLAAAAAAGVEVWGEVELAWRLRPPGAGPWLAVTGTNGKTTTTQLLAAVLAADGRRAVAAGNVGVPLVDVVLAAEPYDAVAVELSSFQLHWSSTVVPEAAVVLNIAPDHLDWHGSLDAYARTKARVWAGGTAVGNGDDEAVRMLLQRAKGRRVTYTLRVPRSGELGLVEDLLVDRAFPDVPGEATELASLADVRLPGPHNVANALAAAALARSVGVSAGSVRDALRGFAPGAHRVALVRDRDGVRWVDDSKATNPHAAAAALASYESVVWVAGGLLKGVAQDAVDDLVRAARPRLRAAVLLGTDRALLAEALRRHAPEIPVVEVERLDTGAMAEVVSAAARLAQPGDVVLLSPAAASWDCFRDYAERGRLFAEAVAGLA